MKNNIFRGATIVAAVVAASIGVAQDIRVTVNGDLVRFNGAEPMTMNGRVFVPLRGVFEQMGAYVDWNSATRTIKAQKGQTDVELRIGDKQATVDGRILTMDAPAQIMQGRTMVPLRFLSESLGANVDWIALNRTVEINTGAVINPSRENPPPTRREIALEKGTVIPVTLEQEISSSTAQKGDEFWMTMRDEGNATYAGLPDGTRIHGKVTGVRAKSGSQPGMLELKFNRLVLPDGRIARFDGSLIGLDNASVIKDNNGVFTARNEKKDDRIVYAGYGAGAGLLVGLLTKKPLEGAVLGGVLGYLLGEVQRNNQKAADVTLKRGTEFGVRLDSDAIVSAGR